MRALVISHAYVAEDNRAKWEVLADDGKAEIELHLPHRWPSWEFDYRPALSNHSHLNIRVAHAFRVGREDQYFFAPKIFRGLGGKDFDVLHVEQGSSAFVYFQALFERNLLSRKTKSCFFTWINWEPRMRWPWKIANSYNLRSSDGAIGGNREAVDILKRNGFRGKTAVIPQLGINPVDYNSLPNTQLRKELDLREIVIGFLGRLVEEKGLRLLLEAAQKLGPEISVLLVGSGPFEAELASYRAQNQLHLVHVPAVSHHAVRNYLRAMDILVLPSYSTSAWKEQFGHVLIEAMACKIPVIGSTAAAIPEVIGDAGLLFQERDANDLLAKLMMFVKSPMERARFGKLGHNRVLECFTYDKIAEQTLAFWQTL